MRIARALSQWQQARASLVKLHYLASARKVLCTPPLQRGDEPFTTLTMVGKRDLAAYLIAIKTFAHFAQPKRVITLCDPSITDNDKKLLAAHIPHGEFRSMEEYRDKRIPVGGCWERLNALCDAARESYVVQLDSDTVTTGPVPEVLSAVRTSRGFMMGCQPNQAFVGLNTFAEMTSAYEQSLSGMHIHHLMEYHISRVGYPSDQRYATGWASFSGMPRSHDLQEKLFEFAGRLRKAVGQRICEWGSEMVASCFLIANSHDATILPFPKYCTPLNGETGANLWHFVGSIRFRDFRYARASHLALAQVVKR